VEYSTPLEGDTEAKTRARRRRWSLALLPAAVAAELAASASPPLVERLYSQGLYRVVSAMFAASFGRVPFSLGEALLDAAHPLRQQRYRAWAGIDDDQSICNLSRARGAVKDRRPKWPADSLDRCRRPFCGSCLTMLRRRVTFRID